MLKHVKHANQVGRKAGRGGERGFTLLELLVAVALLGLVVGSFGNAFLVGMRSWTTAGQKEVKAFEMQRACLELDYYLRSSVRVVIEDSTVASDRFGAAVEFGGTRLRLIMATGAQVVFEFEIDEARSANYIAAGCAVGSLRISIGGTTYVFSDEVFGVFPQGGGRPFMVTDNGGVMYAWGVPAGPETFTVSLGGGGTVMRPALTMFGGYGLPNS